MQKILGIDLGTTNSVVAVIEGAQPVVIPNIDGLAQDFGNSVANALELPRSCAKPSI